MPVTGGFTSAAAIIMASSQMKGLFGISYKAKNCIDMWIKFVENIRHVRLADTCMGFVCVLVLIGLKVSAANPVHNNPAIVLPGCRFPEFAVRESRRQTYDAGQTVFGHGVRVVHRKQRPRRRRVLDHSVLFDQRRRRIAVEIDGLIIYPLCRTPSNAQNGFKRRTRCVFFIEIIASRWNEL